MIFDLTESRPNTAKHSCTRSRVCSLSKGPLVAAGVSDDVAVLGQHSQTHFPRKSTQWCHNFSLTTATWEMEAICRLRVSSSEHTPFLEPQTRQWCQNPRRWTCLTWLLEQPSGVRDVACERFRLHGDKDEFLRCWRTKWRRNVVPQDKTGKFHDKCHRHRAIRAMLQRRMPSPQCAVLLAQIWQFSKTNPIC